MVIQPHTWTTEEIVELMVKEMRAYEHGCRLMKEPVKYEDMAECVLLVLEDKGLIERTP